MNRHPIDLRSIAAGCWACAGALLVSIGIGDESRLARGVVSVVLGVIVMAITWNRFARWEGRSSSIAAVPVIAAAQLTIVIVIWWQLAS